MDLVILFTRTFLLTLILCVFMTFLAVFVKFLANSRAFWLFLCVFDHFSGDLRYFSQAHVVSTTGFLLLHNLDVSMTLLAFFAEFW